MCSKTMGPYLSNFPQQRPAAVSANRTPKHLKPRIVPHGNGEIKMAGWVTTHVPRKDSAFHPTVLNETSVDPQIVVKRAGKLFDEANYRNIRGVDALDESVFPELK